MSTDLALTLTVTDETTMADLRAMLDDADDVPDWARVEIAHEATEGRATVLPGEVPNEPGTFALDKDGDVWQCLPGGLWRCLARSYVEPCSLAYIQEFYGPLVRLKEDR